MSLSFDELLADQTTTAKWIENFVTNTNKTKKASITTGYLSKRYEVINGYWESFTKNHHALARMPEYEESTYNTDDVFSLTELVYTETTAWIEAEITKLKTPEATDTSTPTPVITAAAAAPQVNAEAVMRQIQLPKIEIPPFDGNPLEWENFRDLFDSMIIQVPGLSQAQKLAYLKAKLTGEAASLVSYSQMNINAFDGAWEDLNSRYGNPRIVSAFHMKCLFEIEIVSKASPSELRRLLDAFRKSMRALRALKKPIHHWDEFFVYILVQKLDRSTRYAWETSLADSKEVPTFQALNDFENRVHALEFTSNKNDSILNTKNTKPANQDSNGRSSTRNAHPNLSKNAFNANKVIQDPSNETSCSKTKGGGKNNTGTVTCILCSGNHNLSHCSQFQGMTPSSRDQKVQSLKLCRNCLRRGHTTKDCRSPYRCRTCSGVHHTLLHLDTGNKQSYHAMRQDKNHEDCDDWTASLHKTVSCCTLGSVANRTVLLATARIQLADRNGNTLVVRALFDPGAEATLISEKAFQTLNLPRKAVDIRIQGVQGCSTGKAIHEVAVVLNSLKDHKFSINIHALVLPRLTGLLPSSPVAPTSWSHVTGIPLADPDFAMPGEIDLIVGADLCGHLFLGEKRIASLNEPVACRTPFGWVLMGPVDHVATTTKNSHLVTVTRTPTQFSFENFWDVTDVNPQMKTKNLLSCSIQPNLSHDDDCLSNRLQRFWEMEELPDETPLTEEEKQCEEFYRETYARDSTGRFTVRLPFRLRPHENLSHNKQAAASMQISNERKAASNQAFKEEYQKFMAIYAELEHMKMITSNTTQGTFLPHHGVYRTLPSPKFRVVFNASFKTLQGMSLNQCLMPGQKLQSEPWVIITRARRYRIAFTADIIKMFRQIKVHPEDTKWQQILWRPEPTMQMQAFELTTVTYGTASAPYLALRTLLQLAEDEHKNFPLGARAIRESSYVDDFFTGGDTVEAALEMKTQLTGILKTGGFELSKWASNTPELIFKNDRDEKQFEFDTITTLGLVWNPTNDKLSLKINMADFRQDKPTKRVVLSDVSRLFDPLGWFSPVLIVAKILIQDLWLLGVDWDGPLPSQLTEQWETFKLRLPLLETIGIPRWLGASINSDIELHVFNDASERAYSAAVYMRVLDSGVSSITRLVVAKTKVAPVKTLSVPRLELCGALLGARLVDQVRKKLELTNTSTFAWIDSQVTLAWIKAHASRWSSFVANRVSKIQSILKPSSWRHVKTHENPADLATRGITPHELEASSLWWTGPHWLSDPLYSLDQSEMVEATYLEQKRSVQALHVTREVPLFDRYSEFKKLVRITAYCLRYIRNSKLRHSPKKLNKKGRTLPLSTNELTAAQRQLIRVSQRKFFADEIHALQKQIKIPVNSPIRSLRPFIDEDGVIRVGGRLQRADLNFEEKHPIILQKDCRLSYLIMREAHIKTMHGGPQLSISHAIRTYWITHIQTLAKQVYRECVVCTRFAARTLTQIMGNLPKFRVNSLRPFMACGVDYAGPILLRATKGRGYRAYKGYISVFVCLTTKAVHLEAVSDLSTPGFLAAFRRFISRRGRVQTMVSDNGSNFHGADKELREMFSEASEFYKKTCVSLVEDGTDWSFIPPSAPHMGGIWEAAVKSTKYHLKRVIGDTTLTFEEMTTLLCQIEACLNSRPLMEISNHPDDLALLTPGHFLIGHALTVLPESGTIDFNLTPVKRYERLTSMRDDFWRRWKAEYLSTLQTRKRWCDPQKDLPLGSLVLIKDENTPTAKWPLARVVRVNPGPDGHVRAVTVKTATKEYDRPIHKLCWLPVPLKEDQKTKEEER